MRYVIPILCFVCLSAVAGADDSAVYGVGGNIKMMDKHSSIRMVRETVDAVLDWDRAKVRCTFVFKNEGKGNDGQDGIPRVPAVATSRSRKKSEFINFESWVDGEPAKNIVRPLHTRRRR